MTSENRKPQVGEQVILVALPPGLLEGLREEDQRAITAMVGKPVTVTGYDEGGRVELAFDSGADDYSSTHFIWVAPEFIDFVRT